MTLEKYRLVIPENVIDNYIREAQNVNKWEEWKRFFSAYKSLSDASLDIGIPTDHRFNAIHWVMDVKDLCYQIGYSYCWMKAYADHYKTEEPRGEEPAHTDFRVSYYADNCITRIDSCRDKNALMVWAYYCAFDPEKPVLDYQQIIERLKAPIKFGLALRGVHRFLQYLELLNNGQFKIVEKYRHSKIHRREPRIEIYGVEPHHDWPYLYALTNPKEIQQEIQRLRESLANEHVDALLRERAEEGSRSRDVLFVKRRVEDRLWNYEDLQSVIRNSLLKLLVSGGGCIRVLRRRAPFRIKSNQWFRN